MADWKTLTDQTTKVVHNVHIILRKRADAADTTRQSEQYSKLADDIRAVGAKVEALAGQSEVAHPAVLNHISIKLGATHSLIRRMGPKAKLPSVGAAVGVLKDQLECIADLPQSGGELPGSVRKMFFGGGASPHGPGQGPLRLAMLAPATHGPDEGRPSWGLPEPGTQKPNRPPRIKVPPQQPPPKKKGPGPAP
ncbi:MAG TPA: hypothetical protein VGM54_25850 [Chthoniobacter sp.]|jgi:hypothetical protein